MNIFWLIISAVFPVIVIILLTSKLTWPSPDTPFSLSVAMYISSFFIIVAVVIFIFFTVCDIRQEIDKQDTPDLSDYTAYLDGEEVDLDKINLDLYEYTYDEESHTVYMTRRGQ